MCWRDSPLALDDLNLPFADMGMDVHSEETHGQRRITGRRTC